MMLVHKLPNTSQKNINMDCRVLALFMAMNDILQSDSIFNNFLGHVLHVETYNIDIIRYKYFKPAL